LGWTGRQAQPLGLAARTGAVASETARWPTLIARHVPSRLEPALDAEDASRLRFASSAAGSEVHTLPASATAPRLASVAVAAPKASVRRAVLVAALLVVAVVLRFWTTSDLWLDEALTVNISGLPLERIPEALRQDGAPPLYYLLLHGWIRLFGSGPLAVRSLSGIMATAALPLAWLLGRRLAGRWGAWALLTMLAASPFAVRYATEARMYSLVVLLTLVGALLLPAAVARPSPLRLAGVAVVSGLLLLTHYWSFYLLAAVMAVLAFHGGRAARRVLCSVAAGVILFLPWVPSFLFQLLHTGTPWGVPANFQAMVNAVGEFAGGASNQGRALGLLFFGLAGLGVLGRPIDRHRIELDLRTRPHARAAAAAFAGTLVLAIATGYVTGNAYHGRYAAVVFVPFLMLLTLGLTTFADPRVRLWMLVSVIVLGLAASLPNVATNRTQAGEIARAIRARAAPGDLIVYCPDQLGPAVSRLLPPRYVQLTFPTGGGPELVDWLDYEARNRAADPKDFTLELLLRAGPNRDIFLVWSPGYRTYGRKCESLNNQLGAFRQGVQIRRPGRFFEKATLWRHRAG
jgi:mannosyltransferase